MDENERADAIRPYKSDMLGAEPVCDVGVDSMRVYTAIVEKCSETGLYVGYVPNFPGAHTQGETLDELYRNLHEVIQMLLEDGEPSQEAIFVGTQTLVVA